MAIKLPSNLHRNRFGILYFRLTVPKDLQKHFASKVIYRSLRTANIRQAADEALTLLLPLRRLFTDLRQHPMTEKKEPLKFDLSKFAALPDIRQRLRTAGLQVALSEALDRADQQENQIVNLGIELNAGAKKHREDIAFIYESRGPQTTAPSIDDGKPLSAYLDQYVRDINGNRPDNGKMAEQGVNDHRASAMAFIEIVGDKSLQKLTIEDRNQFDDTIKRYPFNRTKMLNVRGLSLKEILTMTDYEVIGLNTAKSYSRRANRFLSWVSSREGVQTPFVLLENVKLRRRREGEMVRRPFNENELRILFDVTTYPWLKSKTKNPPYRFWIPLIALLSGARINEIAQMRTNDIVWEDDIPCFDISDRADEDEKQSEKEFIEKAVKTFAAKRLVPIHSRLIELGFLDYVVTMKERGSVLVFDDLAHAKIKYGALASKWFANYCDKIGLTDDSLTFHSFRHGAIGKMRRSGVVKGLGMIVVGHSPIQDTNDMYGDIFSDVSIKGRRQAIETLDFSESLDFDALKAKFDSLKYFSKPRNTGVNTSI